MYHFLYNPWVWVTLTFIGFGLCTILPIWIDDDELRRKVNWIVLIPVALILMLYTYPVGIECFRRFAMGSLGK